MFEPILNLLTVSAPGLRKKKSGCSPSTAILDRENQLRNFLLSLKKNTHQMYEPCNPYCPHRTRFADIHCGVHISRRKSAMACPIRFEHVCDVSRMQATDCARGCLEMQMWLHMGRLHSSHLSVLLYPSNFC